MTGLKLIACAALATLTMVSASFAQGFPTQRVTLVVPFGPGGATDVVARFLAEGLRKRWNQQVIVENQPGAGSQIGAFHVARAKPDGYTLLFNSGAQTTLPAVRATLPYDPVKDLKPVAMAGDGTVGVAVGPTVKSKTFKEFLVEAKSRDTFFAAQGQGSSGHLLGEAMNLLAGLGMKAVQYKGGPESLTDVAGGRTDVYVGAMSSIFAFIDSGKIRLLAVFGPQRTSLYPDVPTAAELGLKETESMTNWWGVFAPGGVSGDLVKQINADIRAVMGSPEGLEFLGRNQAVFRDFSAEQFQAFIANDFELWKRVVKERSITAN